MPVKLVKIAYPAPRRPILAQSSPRPRSVPDESVDAAGAASASDGQHASHHSLSPADPNALFYRYASYVAGVATRLLGRDSEVDDVVQDVFLIAFRGLHALRDPGATKAWLTKVAVRVATRRLRWRRVRRLLGLEGEADYGNLPDPSLSSEDQLSVSRIYALLDRLPVVDRVAWSLRRVDDRSAETVAIMCKCSLATAKRRIARVDEAIRQELGHA